MGCTPLLGVGVPPGGRGVPPTWYFGGCYGGLYRPPSKNTVLGRYHLFRPCCRPFSEKSAAPPKNGPEGGGGFPHFFSKIGDNMVWVGNTLLKKWPKRGGTPFLGTFWRFWGFPVKTVCHTGLPGNPSQQRKRYTTHRGSSPRSSRGSILYSLRV